MQHDRNMVHRDLKPENILLMDEDLTVKIGDFGLAKIVGEASFTTTLCGTPSYVAPEILADNRTRKYTKAVDIWSLGVVLYICLCGFPPFSEELKNNTDFPYGLADQIRKGIFDYPSPYWDSIGDPARKPSQNPFQTPFYPPYLPTNHFTQQSISLTPCSSSTQTGASPSTSASRTPG